MAHTIWTRIKAWLARRFRRQIAPGRFEHGAKFAWRGSVAVAPLVWPRRDYLLYVPRGWSLLRRAPLLVLCHGCKQTPEDIAAASRITQLADLEGWLVLLPRQKESANAWCCWNWFDVRTAAGSGEAAIAAAQINSVRRRYHADARRIVVAGMSAGGALAAVLGLRYPQLVRGVFVHSGLASGAAASPMTALAVMARGPDADIAAIADGARRLADEPVAPLPLCVVHGEQDNVVAPRNASALVRQYLRFNRHPAAMVDPSTRLPAPDSEAHEMLPSGRAVTTREWRQDGRLVVRYVSVSGLAHAWSGGDAAYPFNDAQEPSATALLHAFTKTLA